MNNNDIQWIQCTSCEAWFHMECLGMENDDIGVDEDWYCDACNSHVDN